MPTPLTLDGSPGSTVAGEDRLRVLILTASVGEGHDLPARTLADQLRREDPGAEVRIADGLAPMGRLIQAVSEDSARTIFLRAGAYWLWDLVFSAFVQFAPGRGATQFVLGRIGGPRLLGLVRQVDPDVVVSTYPSTTEVLAQLRRRGSLTVPVCAAITDLAALRYWAAAGVDVHLITHPESEEEVRCIAGRDAEVHCVHGLTRPEFVAPPTAAEARAELGLPAGKIVLVSGGGWGVGDLRSAIDAALELDSVVQVVCLSGRNEELRRRLIAAYGSQARVRVEGFSELMAAWLVAADALVHSTGGLTVLEALMCGCPAISFGWGRGHIRRHNEAFRRFGLAEVVNSPSELSSALRRALEKPKRPDRSFAQLPSAASIVLARAGAAKREKARGLTEG